MPHGPHSLASKAVLGILFTVAIESKRSATIKLILTVLAGFARFEREMLPSRRRERLSGS